MRAQQYASGSHWPRGHFSSPGCNVSLLKYNYKGKNQPFTALKKQGQNTTCGECELVESLHHMIHRISTFVSEV